MKNIFRFLVLALSVILFTPNAFSDEEPDVSPVSTTRLERKILKDGPRTITLPYLDCTYNNEYIEFALPDDVNYAEVTLGTDETTSIWSGIITPDFPGCDIPLLVGEYVITCTLDNGSAYQGVLAF